MRIKEGETEEITAKQNGYEKRKKRRGNHEEENVLKQGRNTQRKKIQQEKDI